MNAKGVLRVEAKRRRAAIGQKMRDALALRLAACAEAIVASAPVAAPLVGLYRPMRDEADTTVLFSAFAVLQVPTALPVVSGRDAPLVFHRWSPGMPLVAGPFGLEEPAPDLPAVAPDVVVVPLLAFDRRGHRIGYGAGYYDRTLAALRARQVIVAIGLAFADQEIDGVPDEAHDVPLDAILTEHGLMAARPA